MPGQGLRTHRLAVADMARDQCPQQLARARIQFLGGGGRAGHAADIRRPAPGRKRGGPRPGRRRTVASGAGAAFATPTAYAIGMLTRLTIRDFAVVAAAELEFGPGLTVISGETGAGKSLLVDALGFLSGLRADSGMVRHGADRAELAAEFDLGDAPAALEWLREAEFDDGDECQLRRTLRADGGSRAWHNGRPATLAQLGALAATLVEIHGQHEHQALLSRASQLDLLDAFGSLQPQLQAVRDAARAWSTLQSERDELSRKGDVSERIAWLEHQLGELQRESLEPAAIVELTGSHRRQAHAAALIAACENAAARLGGDEAGSPARMLQQVRAELARQAEHEPRLEEVDAMLDSAAIQLDEALALLDTVRSDLDIDPATFEELDRRLARLHDLSRKHRVAPEGLAAQRDALSGELEVLRGAGTRLRQLEPQIEAAAAHWREAAAHLAQARAGAAARLSASPTALLSELGMGGGRFEVALEPVDNGERPDPNGTERAEFLVAANAGQPPRPLRKVASGGELSRIS